VAYEDTENDLIEGEGTIRSSTATM
jgi:hypothetical protein